jgi:hypothetical protein
VPFTEDQHPVGDLRPGGEHEPFGVGVRARAPGRDLHRLDAGAGQDRVEGRGELPGPVADQEPEAGGAAAGQRVPFWVIGNGVDIGDGAGEGGQWRRVAGGC